MQLHELKSIKKKKRGKVVGRGPGSGHGTYATRGLKGQRSRSGGRTRLGFEGGRTTLIAQTPKLRGFKSIHPKKEIVNIEGLNKKFKSEETVTARELERRGLVDTTKYGVKILGTGEIKKKLDIEECYLSKSAKKKIEKAGGKITEIPENIKNSKRKAPRKVTPRKTSSRGKSLLRGKQN